MTDFWDERQALWDKYRPHYEQAMDGITAANIYVFEHCVRERAMCVAVGELDDQEKEDKRQEIINHCDSVMEQLVLDGQIQIDRQLADIKCERCNRLAKGYINSVRLPVEGKYELDRVCTTCT